VIYDLLVYGKGAMLFHSLRQEMGEELFFKGLQSYFQENRFQNAGKADIIRTFNQVSGRDWQHHFDQWLYDGV
jgi:aminopeptidase N